ncbi:MAG: acyl-CoA dehydrogenase family protein [Candidatus Helarchaeota archaeon]|nr:acyl-CoA dehydrogenase family protein [Candidatus Helarchaeota archaeon]
MSSVFYTTEEMKFRKEIHDWLQENIAPLVQPAIDGDYNAVKKAMILMGKRGLCGAIHDPKYGGTGKGMVWESILAEEVAGINGAIEMTRLVSASLFGMPLATVGTDEQKKKYLPKITSGEWIGAIAMTEDTAGSDLSMMQTQIIREGDEYIINGHKRYITNGGEADIVSLYGVLQNIEDPNPRKRITGVLVETSTKGFEITERYDLAGMEGASVARMEFKDMRVPVENLVGTEGKGFGILMSELNVERVGMAAACVGHAQAAFDIALKYSTERVQFKRPISSLEGVSFRLADAAIKLKAARLLTLEAAKMIDAHQEKEATIAASSAFAFGTEMEIEVTNTCVMTLAGEAITKRTDIVPCAWRMAPVMWVVGGTTDIQKFIIQRELYGPFIKKKEKAAPKPRAS